MDERLCATASPTATCCYSAWNHNGNRDDAGWNHSGHDGSGPLDVAFAIAREELGAWEQRLTSRQIEIEGRTNWPRGGHSIYFRDPDGHLLELATPGLWTVY